MKVPVRQVLWASPAWQHANPAAADRAELLRRVRRRVRVPAKLAAAVAVPAAEGERRALRRGRVAQAVLAVLGEWGHATACQAAELTGFSPVQVRSALFDMLTAGWVARGQIGFYFDPWADAEFWRLASSFDLDWVLDRFGVRAAVEVFGGRGPARLSGQHHARHDLFTLDVMLAVAGCSPSVSTVLGPSLALPERLFGGDGTQAADMAIIRDDGHVLFVEAGLSDTGGQRRVEQYSRLFEQVGGKASVVFVDMLQPGNERKGPRKPAEALVAEGLAARPFEAGRLRERFLFASWEDWFVDGVRFQPRLPARVPSTPDCAGFDVVDAVSWGDAGTVPGWASAHRSLASTSFFLRRSEDRLVWADWLDADWTLAGLPV